MERQWKTINNGTIRHFFTEEDINIIKSVPEEDNSPVLHFKEYKNKENCFWKVISIATVFVKLFLELAFLWLSYLIRGRK